MTGSASPPAAVALGSPQTVLVPGGRFTMGSHTGRPDESPPHEVSVAPFRLARTPITNEQYAPFLESGAAAPPRWWSDPAYSSPRQPVVGITWFDACAYAHWLTTRLGGAWRLPTEAEWERAARGGLDGAATAWGDALPAGEVPDGPLQAPWLVGSGTANGYGLFDMGTIVHEWCVDWYSEGFYAVSPAEAPCGPEEGERRSSRGGSWRHHVRWSPPSARSSLPPGFRYADYGFRVLQELA
jgi:formylglycine-generating enzyme required for sulfatase activity